MKQIPRQPKLLHRENVLEKQINNNNKKNQKIIVAISSPFHGHLPPASESDLWTIS